MLRRGLESAQPLLGLSVEAVKSRLHRARLAIRERVLPLLGIETVAPSAACPDIVNLFSRYLEGDVSKETCAEMERHLEGCPHCRAACASLRQTLSLCRGTEAELEVPASVQASVKVALRTCSPARLELLSRKELRKLRILSV